MKLGKLRVTFKDPDALDDQIQRHVRDTIGVMSLDPDEVESVADKRAEKIRDIVGRWFEYGEYLSVEIDLDATPVSARLLTVDEANGRAKGGG